MAAAGLVAGAVVTIVVVAPTVSAAACPAPPADYGSVTLPKFNVPTTATYIIWTRMKAPSASQNTVNLQVDTANCYSVGGGALVAATWANNTTNWVNYQGGTPANVIAVPLAAGAHTLKFIGVQPGVEVDKVIVTTDPSCAPSGVGTNCNSGDSTGPTVSLQVTAGGQPVTNGQTVNGILGFAATAADASGVASVQFLVDGTIVNTDATAPYVFDWNSATVGNGIHTIVAQATDTKNNMATTGSFTITVNNAAPCAGNPSVPTNLKIDGTTVGTVSLSWNASTPAAGCSLQGYRIYRNGAQVASSTDAAYADTGLTPGTQYTYTVAAVDTAGHVSAQTAGVVGATVADTVPPSAPTNLHSTLAGASSVALAWAASTDNGGVKDYIIYRNGTQVGVSATTAFTDATLAPNTTYSFTVRARDYADNLSVVSQALSVKTLAGTNVNKGDLNSDNKVNLTDLSILLSHYGQSGVPVTQGDVNGNGKVDLTDLSILLSNWGMAL